MPSKPVPYRRKVAYKKRVAKATAKVRKGVPVEALPKPEQVSLLNELEKRDVERVWQMENPGIPPEWSKARDRIKKVARYLVLSGSKDYFKAAEALGVKYEDVCSDIRLYPRYFFYCLHQEYEANLGDIQKQLAVGKIQSLIRNMEMLEGADGVLSEVITAPLTEKNANAKILAHDRVKLNVGLASQKTGGGINAGPALGKEIVNVISDLVGVTRDLVPRQVVQAVLPADVITEAEVVK